jgi:hypothetical protein
MNQRVRLVVPEAPAPAPDSATASKRIDKGGVRLGVLDNSKGNADHLLSMIVAGLRDAVPIASVVSLRKDILCLPAPPAIIDRLVAETDFVVSAMAD